MIRAQSFRVRLCGRAADALHTKKKKWKMELCGRENLFFFFALYLIFVGKLHQCAQGANRSFIFQKGAIVQKRLKTPGLYYSYCIMQNCD